MMETRPFPFYSILISLAIHGLFFLIVPKLKYYPIRENKESPLDRALKVKHISKKQLVKYKTVGVKNGKEGFTMPTNTKNPPIQKTIRKKKPAISLGALKPKTDLNIKPNIPISKILDRVSPLKNRDGLNISKIGQTGDKIQKKFFYQKTAAQRKAELKNFGASEDQAKDLINTDFNLKFAPPKGVSESELNSAEKMFYSFQKRTFQKYISSFISTYNDLVLSIPQLKTPLKNERHFLTARVKFDSKGNIETIKILKSSVNDHLHHLFEETLKRIRQLPNPPKELLEEDGSFTIYYKLQIND